MIPLVLVTGFLGSGKTTFLLQLARRCRNRRVAWVVNEFSARDMDTARLAGEAEDVMVIAGGSIFCRCKAAEFLELLRSLPERFDPESVVIEASGMANPVVAGKMLRESGLDRQYRISTVVAVVDPGSFLKLLQTLPNIRAQVESATLVLLNKTDLYPPDQLARTEAAIRAISSSVPILRTQYAAADVDLFDARPLLKERGELAPCVDPHFVKFEVTPAGEVDFDRLREAVESVRDEILRIKGKAQAGGRHYQLDYSASGWHIEETAGNPPSALVLIARGPCSDAVRELARSL